MRVLSADTVGSEFFFCIFNVKNCKKNYFFARSDFQQIIVKSPQKKTAMIFETDAHLGAGY